MTKRAVICGLFFIFTGLLAGGCRKADSPTIAKVGSSKITAEDLRERLLGGPSAYRQYAASAEGRRQFLNLLVREKVLLEEAKSQGIPRDVSYKKAMARYDEEAGTHRRDYQETLLVESVLRRLRSGPLAASDTEVEKYYSDHREEYEKPVQIQAAHILLSNEADAEHAQALLQTKEPFEKVAKAMSKDPATAVRGGKLAPFQRGTLVPEFEDAVFPLKVGALSGIVKTQFGFHIIKKLGEKALPPRTLPEAKEEIRAKIEKSKFDQWVSAKQASLGVKVNEEAVAGLSLEELEKQ